MSIRTPGPIGSRNLVTVPAAGQKSCDGLAVDAELDRMAAQLRQAGGRQRVAAREPELPTARSTPVKSSVTGCSTWSRVFISMK